MYQQVDSNTDVFIAKFSARNRKKKMIYSKKDLPSEIFKQRSRLHFSGANRYLTQKPGFQRKLRIELNQCSITKSGQIMTSVHVQVVLVRPLRSWRIKLL